jgi:CRP-like cAMP-binding protein
MAMVMGEAKFLERFAEFPVETYEAGRIVMAEGDTSGKLLVLEHGAVEVVRDGVVLARIDQPGELLGELSALLKQPHSADVRAHRISSFRVAEADRILSGKPAVVLDVAKAMAARLDATNGLLAEARRQASEAPRTGMSRILERLAAAFLDDGRGGPSSWYCTIPAPLLSAVRDLPTVTFRVGETVLAGGARTGELLVLIDGAVEVRRDGVPVGRVAQPGEVFGELALLLDRPHTAEVRAVQTTTFHRADAEAFVRDHPAGAAYVAAVVARRLLAVDRALVDARRRVSVEGPEALSTGLLDRLAGVLSRGDRRASERDEGAQIARPAPP